MASVAELESAMIGAVDKLADETALLNQLRQSPSLDADLLGHINNWRRYNGYRAKAIVNLQRLLELRQTESRQPMQKALAAMSRVASGETVATMISLKMVRTIQTRQTRLLIRDLDDDDGESVEPNLIQLKAKPTLDEDEIDETVVMDETIRTPKLTMPNIQVSTVQKSNVPHLALDEPMMSPIMAMPGNYVSSDCTSDSDEVLPRPSSRYRPRAQQQRAPGLVKSISESAIGTPKMKTIMAKKRGTNVLTPRGNERKKQRSKENTVNEDKPKARAGRPPKTRVPMASGRIRTGSSTRSASRSPTGSSGMTKTKSLFDLKSNLFQDSHAKSSLFDSPAKKTVDDKRAEFNQRQRAAEERQRQKKEELEAERKRRAKEKEDKRLRVKARQEQKDKELEEKRIKLNDEKQKQTKTNGKLGKLKKQREQQHAREEEQSAFAVNDSMCMNRQRVRELEEAQKIARQEEEERIREHQLNQQKQKLPMPIVAHQEANLEETIIINKKPLAAKQAETIQVTPKMTAKDVQKLSSSYEITPRGSDKPNKSTAENYNIDDLSSGDETDDDEQPKKTVPQWAQKYQMLISVKNQYSTRGDHSEMFAGCYAHQDRLVDLCDVFGSMVRPNRRRALQHRETAVWAPMVDVQRPLDRTLNLDVSCFPGEEPRAMN